jgi:hypothetical protein
LVRSTQVSMSRFISSNRFVLQSMSCTKVMTPPPVPLTPADYPILVKIAQGCLS